MNTLALCNVVCMTLFSKKIAKVIVSPSETEIA